MDELIFNMAAVFDIMLRKTNNIRKYLVLTGLLAFGLSSFVVAAESESLLNFKFNHLSNNQSNYFDSGIYQPANNNSLEFAQYDATWTYPWETKSMNIDLGVTLRHLSGFKNNTENLGNQYFQEVLPLLHASALFSLPLKGLYAGIEGSRLDVNNTQVFDYRAKVSYEWRDGFGLQGGWQHQQFTLDNATDNSTGYETNGPFLDFYLKF